jgi:hypothetical protein
MKTEMRPVFGSQGDYSAWPDWRDSGRRVEVEKDGVRLTGRLVADAWFTGEDEIPVFEVELDGGGSVSFTACDRWGYLN